MLVCPLCELLMIRFGEGQRGTALWAMALHLTLCAADLGADLHLTEHMEREHQ